MLFAKVLQFAHRKIIGNPLTFDKKVAKIGNRTNVQLRKETAMNETLEKLLANATEEQLIKLMLIAESIVQQGLGTTVSVHRT